MAKVILSFKQKTELAKLLEEHITKDGDDVCHYTDSTINDEDIAKIMRSVGINCTAVNVAGLRKELYGNLIRGGSSKRIDPEYERRIKNIEDDITLLANHLGVVLPLRGA